MKSKALLLIVVLSQLTCHQVIFTAPPGTTMQCQPNPKDIAAFNGVSIISCLLVEEIGTPVADGTVVQFFTNLGRVPEQGRTNDGVVRVNLEADGRSGIATVKVFSGGGTLPASPSPSPSPSASPIPRSGVSSSASGAAATSLAVMAAQDVTVNIGNANARQIRVAANPSRITDSRSSQITATVFDEFGNPVAGVPVYFSLDSAQVIGPAPTPTGTPTVTPTATPTSSPGGSDPVTEHMDSQGNPVFTDTNGQARDVLRTRWPRDGAQRSVVVRASVPFGGVSGTTTVFIN
jgi:hypothetical protein